VIISTVKISFLGQTGREQRVSALAAAHAAVSVTFAGLPNQFNLGETDGASETRAEQGSIYSAAGTERGMALITTG
jgi:hypothetical protein